MLYAQEEKRGMILIKMPHVGKLLGLTSGLGLGCMTPINSKEKNPPNYGFRRATNVLKN